MTTVYLAGPEVFFDDGRALIARKGEIARRHGLDPVAPIDTEERPDGTDRFALGAWISARNDELIARADVCIANLTPFRGVSADPGTVYEVGYAMGLGRRVYGYTNDPLDYRDRVALALEAGIEMPGQLVEDHGMTDNLMIEGAISRQGGLVVRARAALTASARWSDLVAFERCVEEVARVR